MGAYATKFGKQDFEEEEKDPETIEEELEALEKEVEDIIKETHQVGALSSASKNLALKRLRDSEATALYKRIENTIGFLTSEAYLDFALKHGKIWMEIEEDVLADNTSYDEEYEYNLLHCLLLYYCIMLQLILKSSLSWDTLIWE